MYRAQTSLFLMLMVVFVACGPSSTRRPVSENPDGVTVQVNLTEFAIESSVTDFKTGIPYTFVIQNAGNARHDWLIMPRGETDETMALIAVEKDRLDRGARVTVEYTFDRTGDFEMSCHVGRHYEKGMVIPITVRG